MMISHSTNSVSNSHKFAGRFAFFVRLSILACVSAAQPPHLSPECLKASQDCENATDCVHRLAVLQSACVTNTCQPQCREAALNLYQNREGRILLRTDASCVPGRYELEKCGFLPNKSPKHCSFAKLICESDLQCNAKWEVFVSECDADTNDLRCPEKCWRHLNATLETSYGGAFASCTCTDKEDNRCDVLREQLRTCLSPQLVHPNESGSVVVPLARPSPRPSSGEHGFSSTNTLDEGREGNRIGSVSDSAPSATSGAFIALALGMALTLISALVLC